MLDIFNSDAFSVLRLTTALNDLEFVPGRLGEMGLFDVENIDTTTAAFEKKGDTLSLIPPTARGGAGTTVSGEGRDMRNLTVPHFEINDAIYAESVQNVRAFGTTSQLETVVAKVMQRQSKHVRSMAATEENARVGAVKGVVTYADGSTLDLFSEFGVSQLSEVAFNLAAAADGALRKSCATVVRTLTKELSGIGYSAVHAICGDNFFDDLLGNPEVRATFDGWSEAKILREGYVGPNKSSYGMFEFGGIVWENYRGDTGGSAFVDTDKCHIFPVGVPDLFQTIYAPADYEETVNTLAERLYARQYAMPNGKGRHLDVQMNALQVCTRPRVLRQGKRQA